MSDVGSLYERVPPLLERYAFSDRVDTILRPPVHGDSSGVRGAAWRGCRTGSWFRTNAVGIPERKKTTP
jgi:hypothetical protein